MILKALESCDLSILAASHFQFCNNCFHNMKTNQTLYQYTIIIEISCYIQITWYTWCICTIIVHHDNHLHGNGDMSSLVKQSTKWTLILASWQNLTLLAFKLNTRATEEAMENTQQSLPPVCF